MKPRTVFIALALLLIATGCLLGQSTQKTEAATTSSVQPIAIVKLPGGPSIQQIGFRMDGMHGKRAYGSLVAKVDGRWIDVELATYNTLVNR